MDKTERLSRLHSTLLYICLDSRRTSSPKHDMTACVNIAQSALMGGVSIIQLRDKNSHSEKTLGILTKKQKIEYSLALKNLCHEAQGLFAVNDDPYLAVEVHADICHVGQKDMPVKTVREIVGNQMLIGQSTHSLSQVYQAQSDPYSDYFCLGPIWSTPTKPDRPGIGSSVIKEFAISSNNQKPWFGIGGIDLSTIAQVCNWGVRKCVMVRGIIDATNPMHAAQNAIDQMQLSMPA